MADEDVKTEEKPFLADADSKVGETAAEHEEHPDPAQPALQEADDAPVPVGPAATTFDDTDYERPYTERYNPVVTEGTTEVPASGYQFADPNDPMRARYVEMERQKDEDIAKLVKMGDGKPKV